MSIDPNPEIATNGDICTDAHAKARAAARLLNLRDDEIARVELVLRGETVVANKNNDAELIAWADAHGLAVGIMNPGQFKNARWGSQWKNTYRMKNARNGDDRDEVCDKHAAKLDKSPGLLAQIGELKGKVLVCCCYPQRCHGNELARRANSHAPGPVIDVATEQQPPATQPKTRRKKTA